MRLKDFEMLFKALSDKQRLRIISLLAKGPLVVNDIKSVLHVSMSTVSQHLTILKYAEIVEDDKQGRWVFYSLVPAIAAGEDLRSTIVRELIQHFHEEEAFEYDYKLLQKMKTPGYGFKTEPG